MAKKDKEMQGWIDTLTKEFDDRPGFLQTIEIWADWLEEKREDPQAAQYARQFVNTARAIWNPLDALHQYLYLCRPQIKPSCPPTLIWIPWNILRTRKKEKPSGYLRRHFRQIHIFKEADPFVDRWLGHLPVWHKIAKAASLADRRKWSSRPMFPPEEKFLPAKSMEYFLNSSEPNG